MKFIKNTPKIRFKGFNDDWEQCKLGDLANIKTGSSDAKDSFEDGEFPFFVRSEKVEKSNKWIFDGEAILVPGEGKLGDIYHYINGKFDYHQRVYKISDFVESISYGKYILYYMQKNFKEHALKFTVKATVDSLRLPTLTNFCIFLPIFSEQKKVAAFFESLDKMITLQELKLEKLVIIKKSMLEKMFPKNGELYPEIRFKGFTDAWEHRKLKDFGKATGGISIESEFSENGVYKVISIGSYSENSVYTDQGIRAIDSEKTRKRILNKGNLTMILNDKTASGNIIGRVLHIEESDVYVYNQRTERIEVDSSNYDSAFLYQMLNAPLIRHKIIKQSQGNTQIYVNWSVIEMTDYLVPEIAEQRKIAAYFQQLDSLINLHEREIEMGKRIKKGLLKKMFV